MTVTPSTEEQTGEPRVLILDETLDLNAASELARVLIGLRGKPISIDPSQVTRVGAQCVQVLVAASKTWTADGVGFDVMPGSEPFNEGLSLLGLASCFSNESAN
jgi:chemotaxis protein CheX